MLKFAFGLLTEFVASPHTLLVASMLQQPMRSVCSDVEYVIEYKAEFRSDFGRSTCMQTKLVFSVMAKLPNLTCRQVSSYILKHGTKTAQELMTNWTTYSLIAQEGQALNTHKRNNTSE